MNRPLAPLILACSLLAPTGLRAQTGAPDRCLPVVAADCGCVYSCAPGWLVGETAYLVRHSFWGDHALNARIDEWCVDGECTEAFFAEIICDVTVPCPPRPADPTCHFEPGDPIPVCVGSPPEASQTEADSALATFIADVSANLVAAASGDSIDPRWEEVRGGGDGLNTTSAETIAELAALGVGVEILATVFEVEAVSRTGEVGSYLRTQVAVFPDGRVGWVEVGLREGEIYVNGEPDLEALAPELFAVANRMIDASGRRSCDLPLVDSAELAAFHPALGAWASTTPIELAAVCERVGAIDALWLPRIDDITVIIRVEGTVATLRSSFEINSGDLSLNRPSLRLVE